MTENHHHDETIMYNNENSANHYGQQFNSCKNLQVEKSSPTTLCFQIPSELFCCIFEFLTWNEAHSFATRVSMQLYRKLMTEDPCANIYRMFCKRLMEREAKLLLERLDEKNKQPARSLSQLRYSVRKFLKSSSCIFPDLYQLYREPIIAAVDQQALKIEEERQGGITPGAPKKPFIPPKSLLETKSKIEKKKKIEKTCEWKKALQGQLRRHKLLELDILLHQPRQLHWIISTNYNNMRISPEFVQQLGLKIIETFSRIELLSKHTHVIPANILYSEHLKFGSFNYNIFFSFLKLVLDSRMTTNDEKLIEQDGNTWNSQQQQSQNNMFILRMLEFFIEAYFNKFGHYNILIDEPYEGMSALMLIVQLKSPPLLHYVFQKYGTYLSVHMTNQSKVSLVTRFIRCLIPLPVVKSCLLEYAPILCSELICNRKLYPFKKQRNIIHYLIGVNGALGFTENEYFIEWINLVDNIISQAFKCGRLQESPKTQLLRLFGERNSSNFSPIEYLQYNIYSNQPRTSDAIIFKEFIERKVGVHIRPQFKSLQDKYCCQFNQSRVIFSSRKY